MKVVRWIAIVLLGGIGMLILLRPAKPQQPVPKERTEIQYWEKWTGREGDQMKQIVDWFNDTVGKEKNIWVSYLSVSQVDQKTLTATAAGVPPDIAGLWDPQLIQFAALGAVEPLDDLANARGLTRDYYKHVYYDGATYQGKLYALPSTPATAALHWNKAMFQAKATELRAAGLDPDRAPRTIDELDRYATILDEWVTPPNEKRRLVRAGYIPQEPGWFLIHTPWWFGADFYDEKTQKLTLTTDRFVQSIDWVGSYTRRLGIDAMQRFVGGLPQNNFDSPQNPFLTGQVAMVLQGPWMANYIEKLNPAMNRWKMSKEEEAKLPRLKRRENYQWGVAPFPSAVPGLENVTYAGMDVLVIPRGCKHKQEAFEFMAFVNRQDVMEKLVSMHCKLSPLAKVSADFIEHHPNPYIEVFEELASSPNAHALPRTAVWQEIGERLTVLMQRIYLQQVPAKEGLEDTQRAGQKIIDRFLDRHPQIGSASHS